MHEHRALASRSFGMNTLPRSVAVATGAAALNVFVALTSSPPWLIGTLFITCPALVLWMVWQVLTDRSAPMRDLEGDEQWGYQDRPNLRPVA